LCGCEVLFLTLSVWEEDKSREFWKRVLMKTGKYFDLIKVTRGWIKLHNEEVQSL
jgi:hypothetical protein